MVWTTFEEPCFDSWLKYRAFLLQNLPTISAALQASYRGADKSLARPGRKQAQKHVRPRARFQQNRDACCHQGFFSCKAPKKIHAILTDTLVYFLPGWAKDLSAPLYLPVSRVLTFEIQRPEREAENLGPSSAEVKNVCSCTSTHQVPARRAQRILHCYLFKCQPYITSRSLILTAINLNLG